MIRIHAWFLVIALLALAVPGAAQKVFPVPSTSYPTIQSAIDKATRGDSVLVQFGQHTIHGNVFIGNKADRNGHGGGLAVTGGSVRVENNILAYNSATTRGGGIFSRKNVPVVINNTVYGNTALLGGGVFTSDLPFQHTPFTNNIVWSNTAKTGPQFSWTQSRPIASHCNIQGGWPGKSNINKAPIFVDAAGGDFHLLPFSPGVDRGDSQSSHLTPTDFEGDPRIFLLAVDMGADEVHPRFYQTGNATPGGVIRLKVFGVPGQIVTLGVGIGVLFPPVKIPGYGLLHLLPPITLLPLGRVPGTGLLSVPILLPRSTPVPLTVPMQTLIGTDLSNLVEVEIR